MKTKCPICKKDVDENVAEICKDAENWTIQTIKRLHPDWVEENGSCSKCLDYYKHLSVNEKEF